MKKLIRYKMEISFSRRFIWEQLNNPNFKPVEFDGFRKLAGLNSFTLTPGQWIEKTNAVGIISKPGRKQLG
jgi:hypothetical protein